MFPSGYTGRVGADEGELMPRAELADPGPRGSFEPTPARLAPCQCRETGFLVTEKRPAASTSSDTDNHCVRPKGDFDDHDEADRNGYEDDLERPGKDPARFRIN